MATSEHSQLETFGFQHRNARTCLVCGSRMVLLRQHYGHIVFSQDKKGSTQSCGYTEKSSLAQQSLVMPPLASAVWRHIVQPLQIKQAVSVVNDSLLPRILMSIDVRRDHAEYHKRQQFKKAELIDCTAAAKTMIAPKSFQRRCSYFPTRPSCFVCASEAGNRVSLQPRRVVGIG